LGIKMNSHHFANANYAHSVLPCILFVGVAKCAGPPPLPSRTRRANPVWGLRRHVLQESRLKLGAGGAALLRLAKPCVPGARRHGGRQRAQLVRRLFGTARYPLKLSDHPPPSGGCVCVCHSPVAGDELVDGVAYERRHQDEDRDGVPAPP
jgi:hypothetical protein